MDPKQDHSYFAAWSPTSGILFGYVWKQADFPWLGRWEENHLRSAPPWNGQALTCGMEFGVSPFPESRREMVTRGRLFETPTFRWIAAKERLQAKYCAFITRATSMPESVVWDGGELVSFPPVLLAR